MNDGKVFLGLCDPKKFIVLSPDDGQWQYVALNHSHCGDARHYYLTESYPQEIDIVSLSVCNEAIYLCCASFETSVLIKANINSGDVYWTFTDEEYNCITGAVEGRDGLVYAAYDVRKYSTPSGHLGRDDYLGGFIMVLTEDGVFSHFLCVTPLEYTHYNAITINHRTNELVLLYETGYIRSFTPDDHHLQTAKDWQEVLPDPYHEDRSSDESMDEEKPMLPGRCTKTVFPYSSVDGGSVATDGELIYVTAQPYTQAQLNDQDIIDVIYHDNERCCTIQVQSHDSTSAYAYMYTHKPCDTFVSVADDGNIWVLVSQKDSMQGMVYCFPPISHSLPLPLSYISLVAAQLHQNSLPISLLPPKYACLFPEWRQIVRVEVKPWQLYPQSMELRLKAEMSLILVKWMICHLMGISMMTDMTMVAVLDNGDTLPVSRESLLDEDTIMICLLLHLHV